jgi:hypothetical protein
MEWHETAWNCMERHETAWSCMKTVSCCMELHETTWNCMKIMDVSYSSMQHENVEVMFFMLFHAVPCSSMLFHAVPCYSPKTQNMPTLTGAHLKQCKSNIVNFEFQMKHEVLVVMFISVQGALDPLK